jgi:hypothetical protein
MTDNQKKNLKVVSLVNAGILLLMVLICLIPGQGVFSFLLGALGGVGNLICMIIGIAKKHPEIWVSNIIWLLLLPIIGFGCCAATVSLH